MKRSMAGTLIAAMLAGIGSWGVPDYMSEAAKNRSKDDRWRPRYKWVYYSSVGPAKRTPNGYVPFKKAEPMKIRDRHKPKDQKLFVGRTAHLYHGHPARARA